MPEGVLLPVVLKLTLFSLAVMAAVLVAGFSVLAWWNGRGDQAGPPPVVMVSVSEAGPAPARLDVKKGRLIDLALQNGTNSKLTMTTVDVPVEQLVVGGESDVLGSHTGSSLSSVLIIAQPGKTISAIMRFKKKGTFVLKIESAGGAAVRTVDVEVR